MPLPLIIGGIAAVAGAAGVGTGIRGGVKMKEASDTMKLAKAKKERAVALFNKRNDETNALMDEIGDRELKILSSFDEFSDLIEKIQGRPEFKAYKREGIELSTYEAEELRKVSLGAKVLLGGVKGAAVGTAGGFAAAGATTSAVMALGTASTGAAISSLSGIAATNATLAALGGGALSVGGGGMALGTAVLGGATLGVGLLVGGVIFNVTGSKLSDQADEAYAQARKIEDDVNRIVAYFDELTEVAGRFKESLIKVGGVYRKYLNFLDYIVTYGGKTQWYEFTDEEKKTVENTVLLVGLLYRMCQVQLVLKQGEGELNKVNKDVVNDMIGDADVVLNEIADK